MTSTDLAPPRQGRGYRVLRRIAVAAVALAMLAVLPSHSPAWPTGRFVRIPAPRLLKQDRSQTCTVQSGRQDGNYAAFPSVAETASGKLIATWRLAAGHQTGGGNIEFSSLAHPTAACGWGAPRTIASEPSSGYTISPGGIAPVGKQALVVAVVRYRTLSGISARDFRAYTLRSPDGGRHWRRLEPLHTGFAGQAYPSSMAVLPDGSTVMALYGNDDPSSYTGWYARFVRSRDGGKTWQQWGSPIRSDSYAWEEPQLLVDRGQVVVALRYDAPSGAVEPSGAFLTTTSDSGKTWAPMRRVTTGTSGAPTLGRSAKGTYLLAYRDSRLPGSPFRYATSPDLNTWSEGRDVTGGSPRRMLYAGFASVGRHSSVVYALENPAGDPNGWAGVYCGSVAE